MGLFDKTYKPSPVPYIPQNEQEAWIAIMHACIAVDDDVTDEELEELSETLACKPLFEGHHIRELYRSVLLSHARIGSKQLIDDSVDAISPANKPALFAACIELLIADGMLADKEQELVRYLYSALDLEDALAQRIINRVLNRHKGHPNH